MAGLIKVLLICKTWNLSRNVVFDKYFYYLMIWVDNSKRLVAWTYCERSMSWPHCERSMAWPQEYIIVSAQWHGVLKLVLLIRESVLKLTVV